jgi:hypothetical protein
MNKPKTEKDAVVRLKQIRDRIAELHNLREDCREKDSLRKQEKAYQEFKEFGFEHCKQCVDWAEEQCDLKLERKAITAKFPCVDSGEYCEVCEIIHFEDEACPASEAEETEGSKEETEEKWQEA